METGAAGSGVCRRDPDWNPGNLHDEALRFEFFGTACFGFNVAAIASGPLSMGAAGLGGCAGRVEDAVISWPSQKLSCCCRNAERKCQRSRRISHATNLSKRSEEHTSELQS